MYIYIYILYLIIFHIRVVIMSTIDEYLMIRIHNVINQIYLEIVRITNYTITQELNNAPVNAVPFVVMEALYAAYESVRNDLILNRSDEVAFDNGCNAALNSIDNGFVYAL